MNLADNDYLREIILGRLKELDWKDAHLLRDAEERGYPINRSRYSRWKNGRKGSLNDDNLHWIMERLGIKYSVNFGSPVVRGGKLVWVIDRYDELSALKRINILFKKNG
jgi:hypothetical protein